jgi:hypothetical protein
MVGTVRLSIRAREPIIPLPIRNLSEDRRGPELLVDEGIFRHAVSAALLPVVSPFGVLRELNPILLLRSLMWGLGRGDGGRLREGFTRLEEVSGPSTELDIPGPNSKLVS